MEYRAEIYLYDMVDQETGEANGLHLCDDNQLFLIDTRCCLLNSMYFKLLSQFIRVTELICQELK